MNESTNISATKYEYSHFKKDQAIAEQLKTICSRILKHFFFPEVLGFRNYGSWIVGRLYYREGKRGPEKFNNLHPGTQLVGDVTGMRTQV